MTLIVTKIASFCEADIVQDNWTGNKDIISIE